jgi:hypothetical protein
LFVFLLSYLERLLLLFLLNFDVFFLVKSSFFEENTAFFLFFRFLLFLLDILWLNYSFQAASEAKVADLNRTVIVDQDICRLQIAVNNLTFMQIV